MEIAREPFAVLALPRSRTAWLSRWLSGGDAKRHVGHDIAIGCANVAQFWHRLDAFGGTVETGAAMAWPLLLERLGPQRILVVRRREREVCESLVRWGAPGQESEIAYRAAKLDELSEVPGVVTVQYPALANPFVCATIWLRLLGVPFDAAWWRQISAVNVQIDRDARLRALLAAAPQISTLKAEVRALLETA